MNTGMFEKRFFPVDASMIRAGRQKHGLPVT